MTQGRRLLRAALRRDRTLRERLCDELQISRQTLYNWTETDSTPKLQHAVKLRDLVDIPVEAWL